MDDIPISQCCPRLATKLGIRIDLDAKLLALLRRHDDQTWLPYEDADRVTAGERLDALVEFLYFHAAAAEYDVIGDQIVMRSAGELKRYARLYDIADLSGDPQDRDDRQDHLAGVLGHVFFTLEGEDPNDFLRSTWQRAGPSRVMFVGTAAEHDKLAELLHVLRCAQADGSGPCIRRIHIIAQQMTEVRAYDVRDIAPRIHYAATYTGTEAIEILLSRRLEGYPSTPLFWYASGRVVVDGVADDHNKVRGMLEKIRADAFVGGAVVEE
jgi:hypothetical protein